MGRPARAAVRGSDDEESGNPIAALFMALLAPISATIIQLAISRSREFGADSSGAAITADPLALASALLKIEAYSRGTPPATTNPSTAHLFISNPFKRGAGVTTLFSTHPSTVERVERLERRWCQPNPGQKLYQEQRSGSWTT